MSHSLICTFLETHTLAVSLEMSCSHGFLLWAYFALFILCPGQAGSCLKTWLLNSVVPRRGGQPSWQAGHWGGTSSGVFCDFPAKQRIVNKWLNSFWMLPARCLLFFSCDYFEVGGRGRKGLSSSIKHCESDGYCENLRLVNLSGSLMVCLHEGIQTT